LILAADRWGFRKKAKGFDHVHFAYFRAPDGHRFRRRVRHCAPAGFRRDLAADRLTAFLITKENQMNGRFLINRVDGKVMGVAAGLADYTGIDPTIIRLGFVAATLLTGPVMILFYLLAGLLAPAA
jgi:phage shock protein C